MTEMKVVVTVVGGLGKTTVKSRTKIKKYAVSLPNLVPTYDIYFIDSHGLAVAGTVGAKGDTSVVEDTEIKPNFDVEIINATIDGDYVVLIDSELAATAPVHR